MAARQAARTARLGRPGRSGPGTAGHDRQARRPRARRVRLDPAPGADAGAGSRGGPGGAGAAGLELISHGVLPGKTVLDTLDGACSVPSPPLAYSPPRARRSRGRSTRRPAAGRSGTRSPTRPGHGAGDELPLVVMLHGYGGNHADALVGHVARAGRGAPGRTAGRWLPMAMVTVDGGNGYWNPHPGDDPMAMVIDELIPLLPAPRPGRPPRRIGTMGISMGGYGALLLAEKYPHLIAAVAAISPAIWTSYAAGPGRPTPARTLRRRPSPPTTRLPMPRRSAARPVRVASGYDDPFYPGVQALARPCSGTAAVVDFSPGLPHRRLLRRAATAVAGLPRPLSGGLKPLSPSWIDNSGSTQPTWTRTRSPRTAAIRRAGRSAESYRAQRT